MSRLLLVLLLLVSCAASAQVVPPNPDASVVAVDAQAAIVGTRTACVNLAATTAVNLWTLAPADVIDPSTLWMVRYVTVQNLTASATPFTSEIIAVTVGGSAPASIDDGLNVLSGAAYQPQVRRPSAGSTVGGTYPAGPIPIWLYPSHAVRSCITFGW